jgi:hypothetical protein
MPLGVDLGTTNSSVAWADPNGNVVSLKVRRDYGEVHPNPPFDSVERSIVLDPLGEEPIVGYGAEGAVRSRETPLIVSFKRRFDKARLRQRRYDVVTTPTGEYDPVNQCIKFTDTMRTVPLEYDEYSLDEVTVAAGLMFERLLTSTEIEDNLNVIDVTAHERLYLGVPVSFGPTARRRLLRSLASSHCFGAGAKAYKQVLARCRLVYEPLALVSTLPLLESQNVLIVDYGGGTLDLVLLRVELDRVGRSVKELALGGLPTAGDRLDELFREHLLAERPALRRSYEQQLKGGPLDRYMARSAFTRAKVELSTRKSAVMRLFGDEEVGRSDLETAIAEELDLMVSAVGDTLVRGGLEEKAVGTVLLTGGSSLIPAVQERLRERFPHLTDGLGFDAGTPGDTESERRALTGVSRGLARFGFLESFEAGAPCDFSVVVPGRSARPMTVLERGSPDVFDLKHAPAVRIPVTPGRQSVVLYSDLLHDTYCGAIADIEIPAGVAEIEVRVSASRDRFAPAFLVRDPRTRHVLGRFDLEAMRASDLQQWVEGDSEWLPLERVHLERAFLTRPLEVGDFVEWVANGAHRRGKILDIRVVATNEYVERLSGFDPGPYAIRAAREEGRKVLLGAVTIGHWSTGDVRLA